MGLRDVTILSPPPARQQSNRQAPHVWRREASGGLGAAPYVLDEGVQGFALRSSSPSRTAWVHEDAELAAVIDALLRAWGLSDKFRVANGKQVR